MKECPESVTILKFIGLNNFNAGAIIQKASSSESSLRNSWKGLEKVRKSPINSGPLLE
jgi:hypothetical protein